MELACEPGPSTALPQVAAVPLLAELQEGRAPSESHWVPHPRPPSQDVTLTEVKGKELAQRYARIWQQR